MTANRFNFRCWDKQNQHMFYDGYNCWEDTHITTHDYLGLSLGGDIYRQWEYVDNAPELANLTEKATNEYILMQSTGFVDRNGKEIFEGDIIKYIYPDGEHIIKQIYYSKDNSQMYYANKNKSFYACFYEILPEEVEVIGNIYENKELLGE